MSELRKAKKYEDLRFQDDFMFGKVMEDMDLCREVLECLLQHPVSELKIVQTQREFCFTSDGKPIRLDVYNEDSNNVIYDAEMENLNHKSVESHELPKRSRFYQGMIDIDYIDKGDAYSLLPDSNILFICTFDPFGDNKGVYTFREKCEEKPELGLNDGTTKIFYNCTYQGEDLPEELEKLYKYIETGKSDSALTKRIDKAVVKCRKNEIWRTQYMKELALMQEKRQEGIEIGEKRGLKKGIEKGVNDSIEKLAIHLVSQNDSLTMDEARNMAKAILK